MSRESTVSRRWSRVIIAVIGAGAVLTATVGWVAAAGHARKIHGCVGRGGVLRIASHCASAERAITWNKFGPVGPRGPAGVARGYVGRYVRVKAAVKLTGKNAVIAQTPPMARGTYLATATVNLAMYTGTGATCRIVSGLGNKSVGSQHADAQTPPGSTGSNENLAINAVIVHAARGDVLQIVCRDYHAGSKPTTVNTAEINVSQVNDLIIRTDKS